MKPVPAMSKLAASILAIPPQSWKQPISEAQDDQKAALTYLPPPYAAKTQPEPVEEGEGESSVWERAGLIRTIGTRLLEARKNTGWNQVEAAELLGIAVRKLAKLEHVENVVTVDFWLLRRAAEVYGITIDWLYGLSDDSEMTSRENAYERGVSKWLFREIEARYREQAAELRAFGKRAATIEGLVLEQASLADESAASLAAIRAKNVFFDDLTGGATLVYRINQLSESARTCRLALRRFQREIGVPDAQGLREFGSGGVEA